MKWTTGVLERQKQQSPKKGMIYQVLPFPYPTDFISSFVTTCSMRQYLRTIQAAKVVHLFHDGTSIQAFGGLLCLPAKSQECKGYISEQPVRNTLHEGGTTYFSRLSITPQNCTVVSRSCRSTTETLFSSQLRTSLH